MKKMITLLSSLLILGWSVNAWSFQCDNTGGGSLGVGGGSATVYVNLTPMLQPGENLVVDLSQSIRCKNDYPDSIIDFVSLKDGSAYGGVLAGFSGSVKYNGVFYNFPMNLETPFLQYTTPNWIPWPVQLYLTPMSTAGGVKIHTGDVIAILILHQKNNAGYPGPDDFEYTWTIVANNDVVVPTGGCDVNVSGGNTRDVTVTLPDWPGSPVSVPIAIRCTQNQNVKFFLDGTIDGSNSIFANTASITPAQGIGVEIRRNNVPLTVNTAVSLGTVGTSPIDLGLTAAYAQTGSPITAGNVQSIIGVTFAYD